jgi:hypothetical protein
MLAKFIETFFRNKLLIILPTIIVPLITAPFAILTLSVSYNTSAAIWAGRPTYLTFKDGLNPWTTPAQDHSGRMGELMSTSAFQMAVARRTSLAPLAETVEGREAIQQFIKGHYYVWPSANLISVGFAAPAGETPLANWEASLKRRLGLRVSAPPPAGTPQLAADVLTAMIQLYRERTASDRASQATMAISFYQGRVQQAEQQLAQSNEAVKAFLSANPRLLTVDPNRVSSAEAAARTAIRPGLPLAVIDPQLAELAELQRSQEIDQRRYEATLATLEQAQFDITAAQQGELLGFQVLDSPRVPTGYSRDVKRMLIYPMAGLLGGLGLSVTLLVLQAAADQTVRSEADLAALVSPASVLGGIPQMRVRRLPRKARQDAIRRAIGFVAGSIVAPGLDSSAQTVPLLQAPAQSE